MIARLTIPILCLMLSWLVAVPLSGCSSDSAPTSGAAIEHERTDPQTGVSLRVAADAETIGIADRILVTVEIRWRPPHGVELVEPEWGETGWTLIEALGEPPAVTDGHRMLARHAFLLEPFLPGDYTVPPFAVRISTTDGDSQPTELATPALDITVAGVLGEEDAAELDAASPMIEPDAEPGETGHLRLWLMIGIPAVLVLSVVAVLMLTRNRAAGPSQSSLRDRLGGIVRRPSQDPRDDYSRLQNIFNSLDPRLRETPEITDMISVCERARYAPTPRGAPTPQDLARQTLSLLGIEEGAAA